MGSFSEAHFLHKPYREVARHSLHRFFLFFSFLVFNIECEFVALFSSDLGLNGNFRIMKSQLLYLFVMLDWIPVLHAVMESYVRVLLESALWRYLISKEVGKAASGRRRS